MKRINLFPSPKTKYKRLRKESKTEKIFTEKSFKRTESESVAPYLVHTLNLVYQYFSFGPMSLDENNNNNTK